MQPQQICGLYRRVWCGSISERLDCRLSTRTSRVPLLRGKTQMYSSQRKTNHNTYCTTTNQIALGFGVLKLQGHKLRYLRSCVPLLRGRFPMNSTCKSNPGTCCTNSSPIDSRSHQTHTVCSSPRSCCRRVALLQGRPTSGTLHKTNPGTCCTNANWSEAS